MCIRDSLERARKFVLNDIERVRLLLERGELETQSISLNPVREAFEQRLLAMKVTADQLSKEQQIIA